MKDRYALPDLIRGLTLLSMILYHGLWDLVNIYNLNLVWFRQLPGQIWQLSICTTFILLSGFCFSLGKRPLRRGIIVSAAGLIITAATFIFMYENRIIFGILTLIGFSMLAMIPLERLLYKIPPLWGVVLCLILFVIFKNVPYGFIGFGSFSFELPNFLYKNLFTTFFGFMEKDFYSTDYYPVLPWFFLYMAGFFLYRFSEMHCLLKYLKANKTGLLEFMGRHSIEIYIIHQPLLLGIISLCHKLFA